MLSLSWSLSVIALSIFAYFGYKYYVDHLKPLKIINKKGTNSSALRESNQNTDEDKYYDVLIVGAGPAGSTAAYYLAKYGKYKIGLLERKQFPRDKICGDAWCEPALQILEEMGILSEIEQDNVCNAVKYGGFVSPFGYACINTADSRTEYGSSKSIRTYAIKRIICDERIANKAKQAGADLLENTEVEHAELQPDSKLWTLTTKSKQTFTSRFLIIADGTTSYLAQKLGIVDGEAMGVCSRHYVKGGTHQCKMDGVMFYAHSTLPGYSAIFRHYNDDLYLGTYILPGGKASDADIAKLEKAMIAKHPVIASYFGTEYEWRDKLKLAPLRLFGYSPNGNKSYGDQVIVVGDAAAMIDPVTGEGIHTAMIAAKIAAQSVHEMFECENFDEDACRVYHLRWMRRFGFDFSWSLLMAKLIVRWPILLDAMSAAGIQQGQSFLDEFGLIMTGAKPKFAFLHPANCLPILVALIKEIVKQKVLRWNKAKVADFGHSIVMQRARKNQRKEQRKKQN